MVKAITDAMIDPVCGQDVQPAVAERTCYNGIEVYFCSESCQRRFESAPQEYVLGKGKGYWRQYLDRLGKSTGGRPPACTSI